MYDVYFGVFIFSSKIYLQWIILREINFISKGF